MRKQLTTLEELLEAAWDNPGNNLFFCDLMPVPEKQSAQIEQEYGFPIDGIYHILDNYALRHVQIRHGKAETEISRGQIPVQRSDFLLVPVLLQEPDILTYEFARSKHTLVYQKEINGLLYIYAAEIRSAKRKLICGQSLRIRKTRKAD